MIPWCLGHNMLAITYPSLPQYLSIAISQLSISTTTAILVVISQRLRYALSFSVAKEVNFDFIWPSWQPWEVGIAETVVTDFILQMGKQTHIQGEEGTNPRPCECCVAKQDGMPCPSYTSGLPSSRSPTPSPQAQWICFECLIHHLQIPPPFPWVSGSSSLCSWDVQDAHSCVEACKIYLWT